MILSVFWFGVLEKVVAGTISGLILIVVGAIVYKRIKKKQTIDEVSIKRDFQITYVVDEFKRIKTKYKKPLLKDSFSSQVEQELSDLFERSKNIEALSEQYGLKLDPDFSLLMNYIYAYKGVLYSNNPVAIDDEKILHFKQLNNMEKKGIKYNKKSGREFYFDLFNDYKSEIDSRIESKKFLKKYW